MIHLSASFLMLGYSVATTVFLLRVGIELRPTLRRRRFLPLGGERELCP